MNDPLIGQTVAGFLLEEKIGEGGMGAVYRAIQLRLDRTVAVKIFPPGLAEKEPELAERFLREGKLAARISHPNVVQVVDAGLENDAYYVAMEFVQGGNAGELVRRFGPLPELDALWIVREAAAGLQAASEIPLIHRDIKPENILISTKREVKVADFGLAKNTKTSTRLTRTGTVMGTPAFMSPEQGMGEPADIRSDIYSLGITLYFLLSGNPPFSADTPMGVIFKHIQEPLPPLEGAARRVSDETVGLLEKMTAKKPEERFPNPLETISAIDGILGLAPSKPFTPLEAVVQPPEGASSGGPTPRLFDPIPDTDRKRSWAPSEGGREAEAPSATPPPTAVHSSCILPAAGIVVIVLAGLLLFCVAGILFLILVLAVDEGEEPDSDEPGSAAVSEEPGGRSPGSPGAGPEGGRAPASLPENVEVPGEWPLRWTVESPGMPLILETLRGTVFAASGKRVKVVDLASGAVRWDRALPGKGVRALLPVSGNKLVYVAGGDVYVVGPSGKDVKLLTRIREEHVELAEAAEHILVASDEIVGFDRETYRERWRQKCGKHPRLIPFGSYVWVVTDNDRPVRIDVRVGRILSILGSGRSYLSRTATMPVMKKGHIFVVFTSWTLAAFDHAPNLHWTRSLRRGVSEPYLCLFGEAVVVAQGDGLVAFAVDGKIREPLWETDHAPVSAPPLSGGGRVYYLTAGGDVYGINANGELVYNQQVGEAAHMAMLGDSLVVASKDGSVWAVPKDAVSPLRIARFPIEPLRLHAATGRLLVATPKKILAFSPK